MPGNFLQSKDGRCDIDHIIHWLHVLKCRDLAPYTHYASWHGKGDCLYFTFACFILRSLSVSIAWLHFYSVPSHHCFPSLCIDVFIAIFFVSIASSSLYFVSVEWMLLHFFYPSLHCILSIHCVIAFCLAIILSIHHVIALCLSIILSIHYFVYPSCHCILSIHQCHGILSIHPFVYPSFSLSIILSIHHFVYPSRHCIYS